MVIWGILLYAAPLAAQRPGVLVGRVTAAAGFALPDAEVGIPSLGLRTITDRAGRFTLAVPPDRLPSAPVSVDVRRAGYLPQTITVALVAGSSVHRDIVLEPTPNAVTGVALTPMGRTVDGDRVGTAQQQVSGRELSAAANGNVVDALAGKVAGLIVTESGTQGGSSAINLRGARSLVRDNSPLFVVDGIPVSNADRGRSVDAGVDFGSAIDDIDPRDVASVTVLKGANAAALYGSRAADGAILITLKRGITGARRLNTTFESSYTMDTPSTLPKFQNLYGQGSQGQFSWVDGRGGGTNDGIDESFGPRLHGQTIAQFTCPQGCPWVPDPNNVASFFQTGGTFANHLALSGGTDRARLRLGVGTQDQSGDVPFNRLQRVSASLTGDLRVTRRLRTSVDIAYTDNEGFDRPDVGGVLGGLLWFGRQVDMNALRNEFYQPNGDLFNWNYLYHNNPFWLQQDNPEHDVRARMIGGLSATYDFADWLSVTARTGSDISHYDQSQEWAQGNLLFATPGYAGAFTMQQTAWNDNNTDVAATLHERVNRHLVIDGLAGVGRRSAKLTYGSQHVSGLTVPGVYNVANASLPPALVNSLSLLSVNSLYASTTLTWNGWWTLDGSVRQDRSSARSAGASATLFPSVSSAVVLTNLFPSIRSRVLDYAKVRAGIARAGADLRNDQSAILAGSQALNVGLTANPELTRSAEVGLDLGLLAGRAGVDVTYYREGTRSSFVGTSGASTIVNAGVEAGLNVTPIQTPDFQWNTTLSYSANANKVVSVPGGGTIFLDSAAGGPYVVARAGEPYGELLGAVERIDSITGLPSTVNGLPRPGPYQLLGQPNPDWVGGLDNELHWKRWTLGGLLDYHVGGSIFSMTNLFGEYSGVLASTIPGREVDWNNPGIVVKGTDAQTGNPNTTNVSAEAYYQSLYQIQQKFVYSATYLKLRELRLAYDLTPSEAHLVLVRSVNIALVARNLLLSKRAPNIDPEFAYETTSAGLGVEYGALATATSWGLDVRIGF